MLGFFEAIDFPEEQVPLHSGDTLVLFSDGVTEAMDPDEEMFGRAGLLQTLQGQQQDLPLDQLQRTILDSVEKFARGASQADDITLLLVRYRGAAQAATPAMAAGAQSPA